MGGHEKITPNSRFFFSVDNIDLDLPFIHVFKGNGGSEGNIIWTPRPALVAEKISILAACQIGNLSLDSTIFVSGVPYIFKHSQPGFSKLETVFGIVGGKVYIQFPARQDWAQFEYGVMSLASDSSYFIGTTDFVNTYKEDEPPTQPAFETTSATVRKVWEDADDADGNRPLELSVTLSNGESVLLTASGNWTATVDNLRKYDNDGEEIEYTRTENAIPEGYVALEPSVNGTVTTLTNAATVDIPVAKVWVGDEDHPEARPETITISLMDGEYAVDTVTIDKNGEVQTSVTEEVGRTVRAALDSKAEGETDSNSWKHTFRDLLKYADDGSEIEYSIKELEIAGYTTEIKKNENDNGFTITNTYNATEPPASETINITVTKIWAGDDEHLDKSPESVTFNLLANGEAVPGQAPITVSEGEKWTGTFNGLPKTGADGTDIVYTVTEEPVEGYTSGTPVGSVAKGFTITNTYNDTPVPPTPPETIDIRVTKTWSDNNDAAGKRPEIISVRLLANGEPVVDMMRPVSADENGEWHVTYEALPLKNDAGETITYSVTEDPVDDYKMTLTGSAEEGFTITNTYQPPEDTPDTPTDPTTPSRPPVTPNPPEETTEIEDPDTPLAPVEEEPVVDDEPPLSGFEIDPEEEDEIAEEATPFSPFTGDTRHTAVWGAVSVLALLGIVLVVRRRKEE